MTAAILRRLFAVSMLFLPVLAGRAFGQTPGTGAISGVVFDPSGRVISNADVLAVNEGTHLSRTVSTTAEGFFRVPLLPPGSYAVTVKAARPDAFRPDRKRDLLPKEPPIKPLF